MDKKKNTNFNIKNFKRENLLKNVRFAKSSFYMDHAIQLIGTKLPKYILPGEWDQVYEEFTQLDFSILNRIQTCTCSFISIADLCGLSFNTLHKCYGLGSLLLEEKKVEEAKSIFSFLTLVFPDHPPFWAGVIQATRQHFTDLKEIDDLLLFAKQLFPKDLHILFHSVQHALTINNKLTAQNDLLIIKNTLDSDSNLKNKWNSLYDYLYSRSN